MRIALLFVHDQYRTLCYLTNEDVRHFRIPEFMYQFNSFRNYMFFLVTMYLYMIAKMCIYSEENYTPPLTTDDHNCINNYTIVLHIM